MALPKDLAYGGSTSLGQKTINLVKDLAYGGRIW